MIKCRDLVVWRPSNGLWYICPSSLLDSGDIQFRCNDDSKIIQFGLPGDRPIKGDFDGDGILDLAVYRGSLGLLIYRESSSQQIKMMHWGLTNDIPGNVASNF